MFQQATIQQNVSLVKPNSANLAAEIEDGVVSGISAFAIVVCFIAVFATAKVLTQGVVSQLSLDENAMLLVASSGLLYCLSGATAAVKFAMSQQFKALIALGLVSSVLTGILLAVIL